MQLRAKIADLSAELGPEAGNALDQYRWSSLRCYVGSAATPEWLHTDVLLAQFTSRQMYADFIDDPHAGRATDAHTVEHMVTLLIDELRCSGPERKSLVRVLLTAMLDHVDRPMRARLTSHLGFPTTDAARMARHRARERVAQDPRLAELLERAAPRDVNVCCQAQGSQPTGIHLANEPGAWHQTFR